MSEELKPGKCWKCGSSNVRIIKDGRHSGMECLDCEMNVYFFKKGISIGHCKEPKQADIEIITAFNTRPSPWIKITPETMPEEGQYILAAWPEYGPDYAMELKWFDGVIDGAMFSYYMPIPPLP